LNAAQSALEEAADKKSGEQREFKAITLLRFARDDGSGCHRGKKRVDVIINPRRMKMLAPRDHVANKVRSYDRIGETEQ
jgi:hypothetical protein